MIYGYARVSTGKEDQEKSIPNQVAAIEELADTIDDSFGGVFVDDGVSAYKIELRDRPNGRRMHDKLERGDTVIATDYDRLWRIENDRECCKDSWNNLGVTLHIVGQAAQKPRPRITADEMLVEKIEGVLPQYRSHKHGDKVWNCHRRYRKNKKPYAAMRPWGWKSNGKGDWVENSKEREVAERITFLRDDQGLSWRKIANTLFLAKIRKPVTQKNSSGRYWPSDCRSLYRASEDEYPISPQAPSSIVDSSS